MEQIPLTVGSLRSGAEISPYLEQLFDGISVRPCSGEKASESGTQNWPEHPLNNLGRL